MKQLVTLSSVLALLALVGAAGADEAKGKQPTLGEDLKAIAGDRASWWELAKKDEKGATQGERIKTHNLLSSKGLCHERHCGSISANPLPVRTWAF